MNTTEHTKELMQAIFNIQQTVPVIKRESKGSTGNRSYSYASLKETWTAAQAAIKANGVVVIQSPTTDSMSGQFFRTTINHVKSGQWISETMQMLITKDDPQSIGAAITYYRRYMLTSMLGLIPDDDNDAAEHMLATAKQKKQIVGAVKESYPDLEKPEDINTTLNNILGKHPSYVREDEAEDAIELIKAFRENK